MEFLKALYVFLALVSAGLWFWAASITVIPLMWPSGPPPDVMAKIKLTSKLNAWAALSTGLSILVSLLLDYLK